MALSELLTAPLPGLPAIVDCEGGIVTFGQLAQRMEQVRRALGAAGLANASRVAVILPNGANTALTTLGVMTACTAVPINPALREPEMAALFEDIRPNALIAHPDCSAALNTAARLGLPVVDLSQKGPEILGADSDVALLLYTSGTTAKPKLVPLTHANLGVSAKNIAASLGLTPDDRCFNPMPLFHVHGLVGAVMSSLAAGASVVCAPGFEPYRFLRHLGEFRSTWYTAVPSIHQAVLAAEGARPRLRFLRSCSSHLSVPLWKELEAAFDAPMVNCYGMSEGAHQITGGSRLGTVGRAGATEVTILGGPRGEVGIRGPAVMPGYLGISNAEHFENGWLRTGDEGSLDEDGFLTLHGRLKEIINRGGEKISPFEIDEAFMSHPAVRQAIAFPVPHRSLGEEVGVAVVLQPGNQVEERQLIRHAGDRLSRFKVPRRIWVLDEIPKGPTGKPQRNRLAQILLSAD